MKPTLTHPTWHDIEKGTSLIVQQALKAGAGIDWVIGLTRGGLVPGVLFSHMWDVPMMPANYSAPNGRGDNKNHTNSLPMVQSSIYSPEGIAPELPSLLIIDDICDSGLTLNNVMVHYQQEGHVVWTATLYKKEGAIMTPDFIWQTIPKDAPWIVFPWEC